MGLMVITFNESYRSVVHAEFFVGEENLSVFIIA